MKKESVILILDSGIGGLYIFKKIKNIILNKISIIYIMDNKSFPYGNKNYIYIFKRIYKIINYIKKKKKILLIIIACNTASVICYKYIQQKFNFIIIWTLPAIKLATKITKNNNIGLLGTFITINSNYVKKKINNLNKKFIIHKKYSLNLVKFAEKKIKKEKIINIFKDWTNLEIIPDTIIIACTHFHFIKKEIQNLINKKIFFVDYISIIKKKIYFFFSLIKINNFKKNKYFLYTKNDKKKIQFINKKYNFNIYKKIKI